MTRAPKDDQEPLAAGGTPVVGDSLDEDTQPGVGDPLHEEPNGDTQPGIVLPLEAGSRAATSPEEDPDSRRENTTIDSELGPLLRDQEPAQEEGEKELVPTMVGERPKLAGGRLPEALRQRQEEEQATAADPDWESAAGAAPAPLGGQGWDESQSASATRGVSGSQEVGPAFPEETGARPAEMPTRQERAAPSGEEPAAPAGDGWEGFDEGSGWSNVTSEGLSASRPQTEPGDFTRSDTNVYKLGKKSGPAPEEGARLVCVAGKDDGREFGINQRELSIGRGPSCDIVLSDGSVSRDHARLVHEGEVYAVIDLNSANGTHVNGERVSRARVRSGDEVAFGNAHFRFLEIGDVFKPVDAAGAPVLPGARARGLWRASRYSKTIAASAVILAAAVGTSIILLSSPNSERARSQRETVFQYYEKGVGAFKSRKWNEAETQFALLLGLDPRHERALRYRDEIGKERELEKQLAAAQASRQSGDLAGAYAQAAAITDSVYTREAIEITTAIDNELDDRLVRARQDLDAGNPVEALQLLGPIDAIHPGRADVTALRDRAQTALAGGENAKADTSPTRDEGTSRRHDTKPERQPERQPEPRRDESLSGRAITLFADGAGDKALQLLDSAGDNNEASALRAKIEKFLKIYAGALEEHRAKRTEPAIKLLLQAKSFESKITGGRSKPADDINRKLADMYFVQGMDPYLGGRFAEAYKSFKTALSHYPDHKPTQSKVQELARKAKEIYEDGYRSKDLDPAAARALWKLVLQIAPPDNEYHRKAKQWLDSLP